MKLTSLFIITLIICSCSILKQEDRTLTNRSTNILCKGKNFLTDVNVYRQFATGESIDVQTSVDVAIERAKLIITSSLLAHLRVGSRYYIRNIAEKETQLDKKKLIYQFGEKLEKELQSNTSLLIGGFNISCQETYKRKSDGIYETDILLEIAKADFYNITENIIKKYSKENKLDFYQKQFRQGMEPGNSQFEKEIKEEKQKIENN